MDGFTPRAELLENEQTYQSRDISFFVLSVNLNVFLAQTVEHGFPHQPSALAFDPKLELMAIGTKSGAIKVYPFFPQP